MTNLLELNQISSLSVGSIFKLTIVILLVLFHIYLCLIDRPLFSKDYQNKKLYLEAGPGNNIKDLHKFLGSLSVYGSLVGFYISLLHRTRSSELKREALEKEIAKATEEKQKYFEELQETKSENSSNLQISNSPANYNTSQVIDKNNSFLIEEKKENFLFSTLYSHIAEFSLEGQIVLCFLILKSFMLSSIISILFIFYGDMLIEKYQLKDKYPSLAKVIELRVKFRRYYLIYNVLFIIVTILVEITFCIAVLMLEF